MFACFFLLLSGRAIRHGREGSIRICSGVCAVNDRPRISIHEENMKSAAATIVKHVKPRGRVEELIKLLEDKLKEKKPPTPAFV